MIELLISEEQAIALYLELQSPFRVQGPIDEVLEAIASNLTGNEQIQSLEVARKEKRQNEEQFRAKVRRVQELRKQREAKATYEIELDSWGDISVCYFCARVLRVFEDGTKESARRGETNILSDDIDMRSDIEGLQEDADSFAEEVKELQSRYRVKDEAIAPKVKALMALADGVTEERLNEFYHA